MGQEGKSINKVKFQPGKYLAWNKSDPADSGKKVLPGVERFRFSAD